MKDRCNNPNHSSYEYYGGRGISYTPRWNKFKNFLEDMGERPRGLTIDRIDNNLGYKKDNCHWVTPGAQNRNKPNNIMVLVEDVQMYITDVLKSYDIPVSSYHKLNTYLNNPQKSVDYILKNRHIKNYISRRITPGLYGDTSHE